MARHSPGSRSRRMALGLAVGLALLGAGCQTGLPGLKRFTGAPAAESAAGAAIAEGAAAESIETTALPPPGASAPAAAPQPDAAPGASAPQAGAAQAGAVQSGAAQAAPALAGAAQAAAPSGAPAQSVPQGPQVPRELAASAESCRRQGGRFAPRTPHSSIWTCFRIPRDAGRHCEKASDCSSACLAANHTCAPVQPLFGCHPVLTDRGEAVTQCID